MIELEKLNVINAIVSIIRIYFISIYTDVAVSKITGIREQTKKDRSKRLIIIFFIAIIYSAIIQVSSFLNGIIFLIFSLSTLISKNINNKLGYTLIVTTISLGINYVLFFISISITYFLNLIIKVENRLIILFSLIIIYTFLIYIFFGIKRFKYGFSFLRKNLENEGFEIMTFNASIAIVFALIILSNSNQLPLRDAVISFVIFAIIMFITIQKSLQLYYKQKLLVKELEETKEQLANREKEIKDLEAENISISKKAHTLSHKQKSLQNKLEEMSVNEEISTEEAAEVRARLKEIEKDLYKEKAKTKLDKTGITQIDDMLSYLQKECDKNKIDFELQLNGNIHYMTNNLISKEDLETLLADHVTNAIIAINHTDNINRSILVRLGEIEGIYSLYIYDSGIEFEKQTLENLGKKPSTTHANEGGTGMGFMNTFDTLRKCEASLTIQELNVPNKDNYTKAIIIKFDKKQDFKIITYKNGDNITDTKK